MTIFVLSAQPRPVTCRHWRTAESRPSSGCGSIWRGACLGAAMCRFLLLRFDRTLSNFHCLQVWPNAMQCAVGLW